MQTILTISPHTDDSVFGLGATMAKYDRMGGYKVIDVALSYLDNYVLLEEFTAGCVGLGADWDTEGCFPVREFTHRRQQLLDYLIQLNKQWHPEVVYTPCTSDIHQDHKVVTEEVMRAFKRSTIYGYELPWNTYSMDYDVFSVVTKDDVDKQCNAMECYKTQADRFYAKSELVFANAMNVGMKIQQEYAEVFECIRRIE